MDNSHEEERQSGQHSQAGGPVSSLLHTKANTTQRSTPAPAALSKISEITSQTGTAQEADEDPVKLMHPKTD